jgi:hypothetical protein
MSQADILVQMRKLQDEKVTSPVETLKIKADAVTTLVSAYTDGEIAIPEDEETTIQECTIEIIGMPVVIAWSCKIYFNTPPAWFRALIYRDATLIYDSLVYVGTSTIISANIVDSTDAGTYTYYLKFISDEPDSTAAQRALILLEVKR